MRAYLSQIKESISFKRKPNPFLRLPAIIETVECRLFGRGNLSFLKIYFIFQKLWYQHVWAALRLFVRSPNSHIYNPYYSSCKKPPSKSSKTFIVYNFRQIFFCFQLKLPRIWEILGNILEKTQEKKCFPCGIMVSIVQRSKYLQVNIHMSTPILNLYTECPDKDIKIMIF